MKIDFVSKLRKMFVMASPMYLILLNTISVVIIYQNH